MSGIDICDVCHVSREAQDLREEWLPNIDPDLPVERTLRLVCKECDAPKLKLVK